MLSWARESVNVTVEEAAKRLRTTEDYYTELEDGDQHPTLSQLRKLAALYKRPVAVFFMANPPACPGPHTMDTQSLPERLFVSIR
ncbi:helix-turn-helix transcriptional regulator [Candidatus Saccharibacteria bacterium]|nr:helix-turn-helix transcriptional regulator [Candidatus Saccharibacteria bacterium]